MRVPKGSVRHADLDDADREWSLRAAETKARIAAAEERAWQAQLAKAKAALADEEAEWRALRARIAADTRTAEEREWAELMARAKTSAPAPMLARPAAPKRPPRTRPAAPAAAAAAPIDWLTAPVQPAPRAQPVVVAWP